MIRRIFRGRLSESNYLFNGHFVDVKALYCFRFNQVGCVSFIGEVDTTKAFGYLQAHLYAEIRTTLQHSYFDHNERRMFFNNTIFLLTRRRMIELGNNYCQVLHTPAQYGWANTFIEALSEFRLVANEPVIGFARQSTANSN